MMMPWGMFGGGPGRWGVGMTLSLLVWALLLAGVVLVVRWVLAPGSPGGAAGTGGEPALDILKKRYARGEIGHEEFEAKKRALQ